MSKKHGIHGGTDLVVVCVCVCGWVHARGRAHRVDDVLRYVGGLGLAPLLPTSLQLCTCAREMQEEGGRETGARFRY